MPVPKVLATADAGDVLDVPFYVMRHVLGPIMTDRLAPAFNAERDGRAIAFGLADGLAKLHAVDWRAAGLEDFGQPKDFNARHLKRSPPMRLSITHISCARFASGESSVILSVTPNRGGVTDEQGHGSWRRRLA